MWAHCGTPNLESIIIILDKNSQHSDDLDSGAFPNHAMNGNWPLYTYIYNSDSILVTSSSDPGPT